MLHYNELKFNKNNDTLIIDVSVNNSQYYENVVIDSIIVDSQNTFILNGPSSKPIFSFRVADVANINYKAPNTTINNPNGLQGFIVDSTKAKRVRIEIPIQLLSINANKDMLFVYTIASGVPASNTPCGMDNSKLIGTVVNLQNIYKSALAYFREIEKDCTIPKYFIDFILQFKALEFSIKAGNYMQAIRYWEKFFSNSKPNVLSSNCNCNG